MANTAKKINRRNFRTPMTNSERYPVYSDKFNELVNEVNNIIDDINVIEADIDLIEGGPALALATNAVPGLVKKADNGDLLMLSGADFYPDMDGISTMLNYLNIVETTGDSDAYVGSGFLGRKVLLSIRSDAGTGIITLPNPSVFSDPERIIVTIKDAGGNASTYTQTLVANPFLVDGAVGYNLTTNYQSVTLVTNGVTWFII